MSREQSAIIKGIAIMLMLEYHLGCIPGIQGLDNVFHGTLSTASNPINYFLIVSGYGLYCLFQQGRFSWNYLVKRSLKLFFAFWLVLLIFVFGMASLPLPLSLSWLPSHAIAANRWKGRGGNREQE